MIKAHGTTKPPVSLVLYSPRVGTKGHSFLVAPGELHQSEQQLEQIGAQVRSRQAGIVAASHLVTQKKKGREPSDVEEFLICVGASPTLELDRLSIVTVLEELLHLLPDPKEQLEPGKKVDGIVRESELISKITANFFQDERVQRVERWTSQTLSTIDGGSRGFANTLLNWFWKLSVTMKLVVVAVLAFFLFLVYVKGQNAIQNFSKSVSTAASKAVSCLYHVVSQRPTPSPELKKLAEWKFLLDHPWRDFMNVTGGKGLSESLDRAFPVNNEEAPMTSGTNDSLILRKLKVWTDGVNSEFLLGLREPISGSDFQGSVLSRIQLSFGEDGWATWYENKNNRWDSIQEPEVSKRAKALREFVAPLRKQGLARDKDLHRLIGGIWKALDGFKNVADPIWREAPGGVQKSFSELRPLDFSVATPRDCVRLEVFRSILGSRAFIGMRAEGGRDVVSTTDWAKTFPDIFSTKNHFEHDILCAGWEEIFAYIKDEGGSKEYPPLLQQLKKAIGLQ